MQSISLCFVLCFKQTRLRATYSPGALTCTLAVIVMEERQATMKQQLLKM